MEETPAQSSSSRKRPREEDKEGALVMLVAGSTVTEVAESTKISRSTVSRWWKDYQEKDGIPHKKAKVTTTKEEDDELIYTVQMNKGITLKQAIEMSGFPAGEQTARQRLKEAKVKLTKPKKKKKAKARKQWVDMSGHNEYKEMRKAHRKSIRDFNKQFDKMELDKNKDVTNKDK